MGGKGASGKLSDVVIYDVEKNEEIKDGEEPNVNAFDIIGNIPEDAVQFSCKDQATSAGKNSIVALAKTNGSRKCVVNFNYDDIDKNHTYKVCHF